MGKTAVNPFTEARLIRAYLNLFLVPRAGDGSRTITLARFGHYEVRLFELAPESAPDTLPLWMELYAHHKGAALDSFGCDDLEAAVRTADEFMTRAKLLHEQPEPPVPTISPDARDRLDDGRLDLTRRVMSLLRKTGLGVGRVRPDED